MRLAAATIKKTYAQCETLAIAGFALDGKEWDGNDLIYADNPASIRHRSPIFASGGKRLIWSHRVASRHSAIGYLSPIETELKAA